MIGNITDIKTIVKYYNMRIKNYSEAAFEELKNSLLKHIDGGNSVHVLLKMINETEDKEGKSTLVA